MRPNSIARFELISGAIVIANLIFSVWMMVTYSFPSLSFISTALFSALQFLLISFVSRRGNKIAKWIFVAIAAYSVLVLLYELYTFIKATNDINYVIDRSLLVYIIIYSALVVGFQTIAASLLFRSDSLDWFEEIKDEEIHFDDPTDVLMIAIGGLICAFIFIVISHTSGLGFDCYYVGALDTATQCINPAIYKGVLTLGIILLGFGIFSRFRNQKALKQTSEDRD